MVKLLYTSGFWARVRARALRAPVFLGSLTRQKGAARLPIHRSFAASHSSPRNKNNLFFRNKLLTELRCNLLSYAVPYFELR